MKGSPTSVIAAKAQLVLADMQAGTPAASGGGQLLQIIIQIITQLLGSGGIGLCAPTTGGPVKAVLANPNRRHRRILRRTIGAYVDNPTTAAVMEESIVHVGQSVTDADAWALYQEANA